jgi:hypothetical protein
MQIVMLRDTEGDVVARGQVAGALEGEFYLTGTGEVWYRSPLDSRSWYVNRTLDAFCRAALAYEKYRTTPVEPNDHAKIKALAEELRSVLTQIEAIDERENSFWPGFIDATLI